MYVCVCVCVCVFFLPFFLLYCTYIDILYTYYCGQGFISSNPGQCGSSPNAGQCGSSPNAGQWGSSPGSVGRALIPVFLTFQFFVQFFIAFFDEFFFDERFFFRRIESTPTTTVRISGTCATQKINVCAVYLRKTHTPPRMSPLGHFRSRPLPRIGTLGRARSVWK